MLFHWRSFCILASLTWLQIWLVSASYTPYLQQSFFFDWNAPGQPYPIPVTQQCETIRITWERGIATGPDPVSPYYLQVYTSQSLVPFIVSVGDVLQYDWAVPFSPGTLYQICMFDRNGNTGGCQDVYTVIPSNSSTPSCANVTFPSPLQVDARVSNGPMSQFGWIEQCTDISLVPQNGTPPYTMTVAPSLHPPFNVTGDGTQPLNWTVSLSWASSFFVSVVDAAGNVWSNGLLHSAGGQSTACLAGQQLLQGTRGGISTGVATGAGLGGLGVGLIVGLLGTVAFFRFRARKHEYVDSVLDPRGDTHTNSPRGAYLTAHSVTSHYRAAPNAVNVIENSLGRSTHASSSFGDHVSHVPSGAQYHIEPFVMPAVTEEGQLQSPTHGNPSNPSLNTTPSAPGPIIRPTSAGRMQSQVYVVHHDNGRAPVTVYAQEGTQVMELPPGYPGGAEGSIGHIQSPHLYVGHDARSAMVASSAGGGSGGGYVGRASSSEPAEPPVFLQRPRRPGQIQKSSTSRLV